MNIKEMFEHYGNERLYIIHLFSCNEVIWALYGSPDYIKIEMERHRLKLSDFKVVTCSIEINDRENYIKADANRIWTTQLTT